MARYLLILFLIIQIIPVGSILALSGQNSSGNLFKWYAQILSNDNFTDALLVSAVTALLTAVFSTLLSFVVALSWFNAKQRSGVVVLILILGLLPPDILALSISTFGQLLGIHESKLTFQITGLVLYCLPFGILLFWSSFYFINDSIVVASRDLGMRKVQIILKIITPLSLTTLLSCYLLSFLLAFNEYPRTFYLSGATVYITEFLNGKLSSGTNESIYAGGSITVIISAFIIFVIGIVLKSRTAVDKR